MDEGGGYVDEQLTKVYLLFTQRRNAVETIGNVWIGNYSSGYCFLNENRRLGGNAGLIVGGYFLLLCMLFQQSVW